MKQEAIWTREKETKGRWIQEYESKHHRAMTVLTVVVSVKGLCMKHMAPHMLNLLKDISMTLQEMWPLAAKRIIIIHVPLI